MNKMMRTAALVLLGTLLPGGLWADSLWTKPTNNERGMFADPRAKNVGDIVTVVVQETTVSTQSQTTTTFKTSTSNGAGDVGLNLVNNFVNGIPNWINSGRSAKIAGVPLPAVPTTTPNAPPISPWARDADGNYIRNIPNTGTNGFKGGGEITNKTTVTSRAAVTVTDVLPNGNMVIEGTKVITSGRETQYAYLRGIIRSADVLQNNTVLSGNIADARVEFVPEGSLTESQRKGWLLRFSDKLRAY